MKYEENRMTKKLFKDKANEIKKKKQVMISQDLHKKINDIEKRAEMQGVSFPIDEHIEDAIRKLVRAAESQLRDIEEVKTKEPTNKRNEVNPTA